MIAERDARAFDLAVGALGTGMLHATGSTDGKLGDLAAGQRAGPVEHRDHVRPRVQAELGGGVGGEQLEPLIAAGDAARPQVAVKARMVSTAPPTMSRQSNLDLSGRDGRRVRARVAVTVPSTVMAMHHRAASADLMSRKSQGGMPQHQRTTGCFLPIVDGHLASRNTGSGSSGSLPNRRRPGRWPLY